MLPAKPSAEAVADDGGCADMIEIGTRVSAETWIMYEMVSYCANSIDVAA